jgi:hypothetical protein
MRANGYLSSGFEVRDIAPKFIMALPDSQILALVRTNILALASMWGQDNDLIALTFRNLLERPLEKSRIIGSPDREDDGPKNEDFEFAASLPRHQVTKILKAANQKVIPTTGAVRILQADKQLTQLSELIME